MVWLAIAVRTPLGAFYSAIGTVRLGPLLSGVVVPAWVRFAMVRFGEVPLGRL
jgi:hypothetical protein